jgi:hypothetical protein
VKYIEEKLANKRKEEEINRKEGKLNRLAK